ncbi:MAG: hypothetical protein EOS73_22445 [Mesorhizobium sp.]|uniref:hypothetical protein n=1 Tax=unclassified Mesorhizobium TaxID=325217 RepID=UPI000FD1C6D2|nr:MULTISPECIES: hypothetical protein [unclassified Mesorhizobium]RUU87519.1 hypothetical protein EOB59_25490 [Mesorhizobium sp. M7A.F.Ca.MR.176.00.0.0]RVD17343.1 hypothetical protein EN749_09030 [Mesorhizobium sp. M7A.F.Ca.ET.027.02.1.1]RWD02837.1 MAG: hypothetical protein EOS73_22445 [Mesorhizobium sp.]RWP82038.1 MAG: hypothetical protein EOR11_26225 [Mesorhizobium sp.]TIM95485.1 MAG: hypothetical protein E5Y34_25825 [Mesorhizobium sp.]
MEFILACLICGAIFLTAVFIHNSWLRSHTRDWTPTSAEVLKFIDGGEGPNRYLLQYVIDGTVYRIETSPWLVPFCTASNAGSQIDVLVNPYSPYQCAIIGRTGQGR